MPTQQKAVTRSAPVRGTLYHLLPSTTRGSRLLPLRQLQHAYPDLYARHVAKYRGREQDLDEPIPALNCTWADVVFFAPLHPGPLFDALRRSGHDVRDIEPATIDASALDPSRCIIRLMRHGRNGHWPDPADEHDYLPMTTATLRAVNQVSVAAVRRLEALGPTDPWLTWVDVPHILHRGPVALDLFISRPQDHHARATSDAG
ncbi:hypothetical protein GCM10011575_00490 [Microlunatus endophyticus]|uniref:Uncharacterized protein n=1 Tax=Microlunatus endophyticus TaxID=1716077 RepID=A0A917W0H0_9ACTN|nr:hypothetical protein [Microlunatus endophyticus]GGL46443.1 hypothetical protein GCM10011575_00490 [Microlunatus endophyticus]